MVNIFIAVSVPRAPARNHELVAGIQALDRPIKNLNIFVMLIYDLL